MAFLKETSRSMRAYLLLVGAVSVMVSMVELDYIQDLSAQEATMPVVVPTSWTVVLWIGVLTGLAMGAGFIAAGFKLESALRTGTGWIRKVLYASIGLLVVNAALTAGVLGIDTIESQLGRGLVGIAITFYLLHNLKRLEHEAQHQPAARVA